MLTLLTLSWITWQVPPAAGDEVAPVRDVPSDPAWDVSEDTGHHSAAERLPVGRTCTGTSVQAAGRHVSS